MQLRTGGHKRHGGARFVMIAERKDHPLTKFGPRFKAWSSALHYALNLKGMARVVIFNGNSVEWDSSVPSLIFTKD